MTKQNPTQFPQLLEAVKAHEELAAKTDAGRWRIGAAIIAEGGPPGKHGVNTGANDKLRKATAVLKKLGYPHYTFRYLKMLRTVAANFPEGNRFPSVSWTIHYKAGTPTQLRQIVEHAERRRKPLTVRYVEKFLADEKARRKSKRNGEPDTARAAATQRLLENVVQVHELKKDTAKAFNTYPRLTPEEVTAVKGLLEDWNQFLRAHGAGADQLLEAAE